MTLPSPIPVSGPLRVKELNPAQVTAILGNDPRLIIPIGTCEQHGPHLPLGCDTIIVILLTAHGHDPHQEALATVITTAARVRVVDMFGVNLSDLLEGQREAMHGDEVDTSIMLFLFPDMVSLDQAQDYMMSREQLRRYRRGSLTVPSGSAGSIGRPSFASAEKGKRIYERIYSKISDRIFLAPSPTE